MNKKKLVSGITATGTLTLGNYIGAIKNFVKLQDKYEMFIFVADLHALTIEIEPKKLKENKKDIMALYIAAGLDPKRTTLFNQSDVEAHGQMGWIMENQTTIGELSRMTQFKDKSSVKESNGTEKVKTGLLTYPTLMAGDILLYNPDVVPVGIDQKQHLELTRNIASRFNNKYGETFVVPAGYFPKVGAKIMSLTEPTKKMSKSSEQVKSYISLLDEPEVAAKKIMKAVTDSEGKVYISDDKPGITNLITIKASLDDQSPEEVAEEFKDADYGTFKKAVATTVKEFLEELQERFKAIYPQVDQIANEGALKARVVSNLKLNEVKEKLGL